MKINVITLCSGYDSQCMALDKLKEQYDDFDYELQAWSEIDKYAIEAHNLMYPQWSDRNVGDMTKVDWTPYVGKCDLLTYSTPCQDISQAGKQAGLKKGSDTRSGILWYTEEAIRILRPKYLLQENVKALVSKKFMPDFIEWGKLVESYGYRNFWKVLDAKDFGVPQHRERVFMVSILERGARYEFPKGRPLDKLLKDVLEQEADESYFLSQDSVENFMKNSDEFKNKHDFSEGDGKVQQ